MSRTVRFAVVLLLAAAVSACGGSDTPTSPSVNVPFATIDIRVGTGAQAVSGRRVTVAYVGWLYSTSAAENKGTRFDGGVYAFTIGASPREVILGWEQGISGMRVGGQRRLIIPPDLAYGSAGSGPIPPNATLVFDVELTTVQ
jgi:FKBP-type peptidyl-prolyl cis-trans isomerase FkpA